MIEDEIAVIGSILVEPSCLADVSMILAAEHFEKLEHQDIFKVIRRMKTEGKPIDTVTVASEMNGELKAVGGKEYIFKLSNLVPSPLHAVHYATQVRESARLRRVSQLASMLSRSPNDEATSKKFKEALSDTGRNGSTSIGMKEAIVEYQEEIDRRIVGKEPIFKTGFKTFDLMCAGGLRGGQLFTIGARTSKGKSSILLQMAVNIASRGGRVLFHSQEMGVPEMLDRVVSMQSTLSVGRVRASNRDDVKEILGAVAKIYPFPIRWGNQKKFGLEAFQADVERETPDVLIVDYLQRIPVGSRDNRAAHFSDVANGLKSLALQTKTVVITASQLSRQVELRDDHTPTLADLKESGGIEEASDIVALIHTPEENLMNGTRSGNFIVAKNRNGATASIPICFEMAKTRFSELN